MQQDKIGKFILQLRKEKNMTQQELADKLGVTDRAISKWENGRGMPDVSLMKPLCHELGITINDLLSGERVEENDEQAKFEETLLTTIDYKDRKIKKNNRLLKIALGMAGAFIISLIAMFLVDVSMMKQNKPVIFSTWGFYYTPAIDLREDEIQLAIKHYLVEKGDSEPKQHDGEKTFVSIRVYLLEEKERDNRYYVYAWVREGKYYLEQEEIKQDSGSSIPYKFTVEKIDGNFVVTDSRIPRDGSYYAEDMKKIFPRSVRNDMKDVHSDGTVARLGMDIEEQVKLYFH